jgi:hypothetical protein
MRRGGVSDERRQAMAEVADAGPPYVTLINERGYVRTIWDWQPGYREALTSRDRIKPGAPRPVRVTGRHAGPVRRGATGRPGRHRLLSAVDDLALQEEKWAS